MKANGRRYRRYRIRMPVALSIGKHKLFLETADVGMGGVFLSTDARPKDGEFVRLAVALPFGGGALELLGRITSVRQSDPVGAPGVGVSFYGNGPTERDAWQGFVREIERRHPEAVNRDVLFGADGVAKPAVRPPALPRRNVPDEVRDEAEAKDDEKVEDEVKVEAETDIEVEVDLESESAVEVAEPTVQLAPRAVVDDTAKAERRRFRRIEVVVEVRAYFDSIEDLVSMHTRDLSQGGMFIGTTVITAAGERLTLRVVHPKTKAEFPIPCVVRRCVSDAEQPGLAVEFELDEAGRNSFWIFIGNAVVPRSESGNRSVNYF